MFACTGSLVFPGMVCVPCLARGFPVPRVFCAGPCSADTVRSPVSNDNVSIVLIVFNQFGVVTGHAGAAGGWRGFAAASKPFLRAPLLQQAEPCPLPPLDANVDTFDAFDSHLSSAFERDVSEAVDENHADNETMAHTPTIGMVPRVGKPMNHHLDLGHHGGSAKALFGHGHGGSHAPSPLRTLVMPALQAPPSVPLGGAVVPSPDYDAGSIGTGHSGGHGGRTLGSTAGLGVSGVELGPLTVAASGMAAPAISSPLAHLFAVGGGGGGGVGADEDDREDLVGGDPPTASLDHTDVGISVSPV